MPMLSIPTLLTDSNDRSRVRFPVRIFRGTSLLEVVLAATITTSLVGLIASSLEVSRRLWQTQEANSAVDLSHSATRWLVDQIHQANDVHIVNSSSLELVFVQGSTTLKKTVTRQGNSLVAINQSFTGLSPNSARWTETIAEPVSDLRFTDPSGRGYSVRVQVTAQGNSPRQPNVQQDRVISIDWLKS